MTSSLKCCALVFFLCWPLLCVEWEKHRLKRMVKKIKCQFEFMNLEIRSSCGGKMGSVLSWKLWDTGLIPGLAQWAKDPLLLQLQLRSQLQLGCDPWPRNSICWGAAKKKKKEKVIGEKSPRNLDHHWNLKLKELWSFYNVNGVLNFRETDFVQENSPPKG